MELAELRRLLDDAAAAESIARGWGLSEPQKAHGVLVRLAESGVPLDLLTSLSNQLAETLPRSSDPDLALTTLGRWFEAARSPLSTAALLERDREALPTLLTIFAASRHFGDLLVADAESYDLLRMTEGAPVQRDTLVGEISAGGD